MSLKIYNTLSGQKEKFVPFKKDHVGMYVCGPTVYDHCHVGHARAAIVFDVIYRYLLFVGYQVNYVRNFTDIDDKIINRAKEDGLNWKQLAETYIQEFYKDMGKLFVQKPTHEPKATEHIEDMQKIIQTLIEKGMAYEAGGDVLFSVRKFVPYGKLSKRNLDDLMAGARVEPGEHKKDPLDFVLWKKSKPDEPSWESPWGSGRPGWHIECSAMGKRFLGNQFDIHGGGKDLIFPHHENEIAQSEGAHDVPPVRYWVHNGFVNIDKEKMSKSLKNFFTIKDIIKKYRPESVRLFLLSTHYRSPVEFSDASLKEMDEKLDRFYEMMKKVQKLVPDSKNVSLSPKENKNPLVEDIEKMETDFKSAMNDDFNTALAIGNIFGVVRKVNKHMASLDQTVSSSDQAILKRLKELLSSIGSVLGIFITDPEAYFKGDTAICEEEIEVLIQKRIEARKQNNWSESDRIRDELLKKGIILQDTKTGTTWRKK